MTAVIHGITLFEAGPHTHRKAWVRGVYITHCSDTDGPCQGHARPPSSPPERQRPPNREGNGEKCDSGHTDVYFRWFPTDGRWHLVCRPCGNERKKAARKAAREMFNNRKPRREAA